ncbi:hypothetical protein C0995_001355 [Termitomyces sp. Mi166|nr:hypothetical protein C0995_001355 [Termitomyces sp. Mi166\
MYKLKDVHVQGQRMLTQSQSLLKSINDHIKHGVTKYNEMYRALMDLSTALKKTDKAKVLQELTDADLGGIMAEGDTCSEGSRTISPSFGFGSGQKAITLWMERGSRKLSILDGARHGHEHMGGKRSVSSSMRRFTHLENVWKAHAIDLYHHIDVYTQAGL